MHMSARSAYFCSTQGFGSRWFFALVFALAYLGVAGAQYPILDTIADKVVQKYEQSSCEQLWEKKGQPKSLRELLIADMHRRCL
jgi:hypothetical protein